MASRKSVVLIVALSILSLTPPLEAEPVASSSPSAISLAQVLEAARDRNPDINSARQAWEARRFEIGPARTWPDPTFSYVDEKIPSGMEGADPETMRQYRAEQMIPFPGKLSTEARMKYHEARIAESQYRDKVLEVQRDVRSRYYQLYLTDRSIELARQSVELMKNMLRTAQARLSSGQSTSADVFMSQTELRKMENMLFEQEQQRTLIQIELNTLVNQPTDTPWGKAAPPEIVDIPASLANLQALAEMKSPMFASAMHEVDHGRSMKRRSRLGWAPDFGLMYERQTMDEGPAGREIGVSLTFPLWFSRPRGEARAANAHSLEAEAMAESMRSTVRKMIHMEFTETNTHLRLTRSYVQGLLPAARGTLDVTREHYVSGRGDFIRFLEAFRAWITANVEYENQLYHYGEHWSELERWVGIDLAHAKEALSQKGMEMPNGH